MPALVVWMLLSAALARSPTDSRITEVLVQVEGLLEMCPGLVLSQSSDVLNGIFQASCTSQSGQTWA